MSERVSDDSVRQFVSDQTAEVAKRKRVYFFQAESKEGSEGGEGGGERREKASFLVGINLAITLDGTIAR